MAAAKLTALLPVKSRRKSDTQGIYLKATTQTPNDRFVHSTSSPRERKSKERRHEITWIYNFDETEASDRVEDWN
jgi:hypothetical protein